MRAAIETSVARVEDACGQLDAQAMYEALSECLSWLCALDETLMELATVAI